MRVGSLVYATDQGLGILAKSFYDHGIVTDALVVRHHHHPTHDEWYPPSRFALENAREFLKEMDTVLFFETPFQLDLIPWCRKEGVKTALMTMYECTHQVLLTPQYQPDIFLCPSLLDLKYFPSEKSHFIPVPVEVPWRLRTRAESFVFNAGHGGLRNRNGMDELMQALPLIRSPIQLLIRTQKDVEINLPWLGEQTKALITHVKGTVPYEKLHADGDVCIRPEKFNGLSLPLQEARAAGMLVMTSDRFPMNTWLPREPLIHVHSYRNAQVGRPYLQFDEAVINPEQIAATIDEWYGRDITEYSLSGKRWAESMSWEKLAPIYKEILWS